MNEKLKKFLKEKEDCFKFVDYGNLPNSIKKEIFEMAWDFGHDCGDYQVKAYYEQFTEFVEKIIELHKKESKA